MSPLNLASQPFRNERLPLLVIGVAGLVLVGLTVWHAVLIHRLLPGQTSVLHQEVSALEKQAAALRSEARSLHRAKPAAAEVAEWTLLRDLVDRRSFSWTDLFAVLEDVLPDGVRLGSIAPKLEKGRVELAITAVARSYEDGLDFIRVLEEQPEFEEVLPMSRTDDESGRGEGVRFDYRMTYRPPTAPRAPAAAAPASPPSNQEPGEDGAAGRLAAEAHP